MNSFLLSSYGALAAALFTTFLAALESAAVPWAPFLILYAVALPAFPLALGTYSLGSPAAAFGDHAWAVAILFIAMLAWEGLIAGYLYERKVLAWLGKAGAPGWSPAAAMETLLQAVVRKTGWTRGQVNSAYGVYFLLWAPIAEELFFWGYLYPVLRPGAGPYGAAAAVAGFFGLRHGLHFLFLPAPPWRAAAAIVLTAGVSGLLNSLLYELTQSLWPLILLHLASNILASFPLGSGPGAVKRD